MTPGPSRPRRTPLRRPLLSRMVEALEPRALLSVAPAGPEFRASTTSTSFENTRHGMSAVAMDADGDFVVVWGDTAMGQRFNAAGVPHGGPFALASDDAVLGSTPSVAMNASGDFVTTFHRNVFGVGYVFARRFNADGTAKGPEQWLGGSGTVDQSSPSVAMESDGDFVVAWHEGGGAVLANRDVYARRFNADGTPNGDVLRVNTYRTGPQDGAAVAVNDAGSFVVTWNSWEQDGSEEGVYARVYDAAGEPVGDEIQVNQDEGGQQRDPSVAMDASGRFALAWQSPDGVMLRRFAPDGTPLHDERDVDGPDADGDDPFVVSDAAGGLVLCWEDYTSEADFIDTYYRRFGADGQPLGTPTRVNETIPGRQGYPSLAMRTTEQFVVVWSDGEVGFPNNPNATPDGVYGRLFVPADLPPATVVGRHVFYNNSAYDGDLASTGPRDDAAIATDKNALLAGQRRLPGFDNVTSYHRGINGVMVDVDNLPDGAVLTTEDFDFGGALRPVSVTVRPGAGVDGSDRVTLVWTDYSPGIEVATLATANRWLTITVKATANTGLARPDVFAFGNLIGETGDAALDGGWRVNALDLAAVKRSLARPAPIGATTDFNRDGRTDALDVATVKRNLTKKLAAAPVMPAAPASSDDDSERALGEWVSGLLA